MSAKLKKALFAVCCIALAVRTAAVYIVSGSVLQAYNLLPGLDMETLLRFSNWTSGDPVSAPMFVLHRFLLFFSYLLAGGSYDLTLIHILQALAGTAAAVFAAYGAYLLTKKEYIGLAAGIIYAVYGPILLYECVALQESLLVHTLTIALALYIKYAEDPPANRLWGAAAGIMLGLNSAGRPASAFAAAALALYPLLLCRKRKLDLSYFTPLCGTAAIWLAAALFNGYFRNSFSPFFNVMPHLTDIHASGNQVQGVPADGNELITYGKVLLAAVKGVPHLMGIREIPENLDYCLLAEKYLLFRVGPFWLIPPAVTGIIAMALLKRKNCMPLFIAFAALLLPLAARCPIGRYRLMLIPVFIWFAAEFINELIANKNKRLALAAILIGVLGCNLPDRPFLRPNPAANHTYALACIKAGRKAEAVSEMQNAWKMSNYTYAPSGLYLITEYFKAGDLSSAEKTIAQNRSDSVCFPYYCALIKTARNKIAEAEKELKAIKEPRSLGQLYPKYLILQDFLKKQTGKL